MRNPKESESWKRMVLRSQSRPAWLSEDAPHGDVVLSSRTRIMRNLARHRFPSTADNSELQGIMNEILGAARQSGLELETYKALTNAERDYLVGCRLVSPDFEWTLPGRALLMNRERSVSLMVNEEDHLRIQALTAGWSVDNADVLANSVLSGFESRLSFASSSEFGYLSASPYNAGIGRRQSSMFHLIGLATAKRLPSVMKALSAKGIVVRGLFGESSRAIGAFVQVSVTTASREDFVGACEYLLTEEREGRRALSREDLAARAEKAREFVTGSRIVSLADALRVLAWFRWAASVGLDSFPLSPRAIDHALTLLEIRSTTDEAHAGRERADYLKTTLGIL